MSSQNCPKKVGRPRKIENATIVDTMLTRSKSKKRILVLTDDEANVSLLGRKKRNVCTNENNRKISYKRKSFTVESPKTLTYHPRPKRHSRSAISEQYKSGIDTSTTISKSQQAARQHLGLSPSKAPAKISASYQVELPKSHLRPKPAKDATSKRQQVTKKHLPLSNCKTPPKISASYQENLQAQKSKPLDKDILIDKTNSDKPCSSSSLLNQTSTPNASKYSVTESEACVEKQGLAHQDKVQLYSTLSKFPEKESDSNDNESISDDCKSLIYDNPILRQFNWFYPDIWEKAKPSPRYLRNYKDLVTKQKERELKAHVELNKIFCESDLSDLQQVFPDCISKPCLDTLEGNTQLGVTTIELPGLSSDGIKLSNFLDVHKMNSANYSGLDYNKPESSFYVKKEICNKFFKLCSDAGLNKARFSGDSNKVNVTSKTVPLLTCKTSINSDEQNDYLPHLDSVSLLKPSKEESLFKHFSEQQLFDPTNTKQLHDSRKRVEENQLHEFAQIFPAKYKKDELPLKPTSSVVSTMPQEAETSPNHTVNRLSQAHQMAIERGCLLKSKNFYTESELPSFLNPEFKSAEILNKPTLRESYHITQIAEAYLTDSKRGRQRFENFSFMYPKYKKYKEPLKPTSKTSSLDHQRAEVSQSIVTENFPKHAYPSKNAYLRYLEDSQEDLEVISSLSQQKNEVTSCETNNGKISCCQRKEAKILARASENKKNQIFYKHKNTSSWKHLSGPSNVMTVSKLPEVKVSLSTNPLARSQLPQAVSESTLSKLKKVTSKSSKFKVKKSMILSRCKTVSTLKGISKPMNSLSQAPHSDSLSELTNLMTSPQPMHVDALLAPTTKALAQPEQAGTLKTCKRKRATSFTSQSKEDESLLATKTESLAQLAAVETFATKKRKKIKALISQSKTQAQTEIISKTQPALVEVLNNVLNEDIQKSGNVRSSINIQTQISSDLPIGSAGILNSNIEQTKENETLRTKEQERKKVIEVTKCLMENITGLLKSNLQGIKENETVLTKEQEEEIIRNIVLAFEKEQIKIKVMEVISNNEDNSILKNLPGPSNTQLTHTDDTLPVPRDVHILFKSKHDEMSPRISVVPDLSLCVQTEVLQDHANAQEMLKSEKYKVPKSIMSSIQLTPAESLNVSEALPKATDSKAIPIHCEYSEQKQVDTFPGTQLALVEVLCKFLNGENTSEPEMYRNLLNGADSQLSSDISNDSAGPLNVNMQQTRENETILTKEQEDKIKQKIFLALKKEQEKRKVMGIVDKFIESTIASPLNSIIQGIKENEILFTKEQEKETIYNICSAFKKEQIKKKVMEVMGNNEDCKNFKVLPASLNTQPTCTDNTLSVSTNVQVLIKPEQNEMSPGSSDVPALFDSTEAEVLHESPNVLDLSLSEQTEMLQNNTNPGILKLEKAPQVPEPQTILSSITLTQTEPPNVLKILTKAASVKDEVVEPMHVDTFPDAQLALVEVLRKFLKGEDASELGMCRNLSIDTNCQLSSGLPNDNAGPSNINEQQTKEKDTLFTKEQEDKIKQALFLALKKEQERRKALEIIKNFIKTIINMKFPPKK